MEKSNQTTGDQDLFDLDFIHSIDSSFVLPPELDTKSKKEESIFIKGKDYLNETGAYLRDDRYKKNTWLRLGLAAWTILLVSVWLWKVGEILINNNEKYCLSDSVLITLLTTTTINVLGLVFIVLKDLFNGKSENPLNTEIKS